MSLNNCQTKDDLFLLYELTNFYEEYNRHNELPKWQGIRVNEEEEYVHVPQCSNFGSTLISLDDVYENSGFDCLFIQELVKLYMEGKIEVKQEI